MAEYIERNALLDEIKIAPVSMSICMNVGECKGRIYERERLVRIINEATAADVAPVLHGRWIKDGEDGPVYCSQCGEEHEWEDYRASYCDTCGARMDGDGE